MTRRTTLIIGFALGGLVAPAVAAAAAAAAPTAAQVGSLQRTAASVDDALDVYRLALLELVPALRLVLATGQAAGTTPGTPLPAPAAEVFTRLAASVNRRVSAEALPAVPRAYHAEVVDALEGLAAAASLGGVLGPSRALTAALGKIAATADDVVDIFSRQRPILADVMTPSTALDDINEALSQLSLAEANIGTVRARRGAPGEQLQAFLRLEIALGHALDLIAAAEESGIHIGFEMSLSTVGLARRLASVHTRLAELREVVATLGREPHAIGADFKAEMVERVDGGASVDLTWTPPEAGRTAPALVRIYRRANLPAMSAHLAAALRCDGQSADAAARAAQAALAPYGEGTARHLTDMPPGRGAYSDGMREAPPAPPLYRLVAVSAFGVESKGQERAALSLPKDLGPPLLATARAASVAPDSAAFYRDADAVTVTWQASASDVSGMAAALQFAEARGLPTVRRYEVFRLEPKREPFAVGYVPAGITQWVDRPPLQALRDGVKYAVAAVDMAGHQARGAGACAESNGVQANLTPAFALAEAGAAYMGRPSLWERRRAEALVDPNALAAARATFAGRLQTTQEAQLAAFWQATPPSQRIAWLEAWPSLMSDAERAAWLRAAPAHLRARDVAWAQAEVWLAEHPDLSSEVDRWWRLLDEAARRAAWSSWRSHLNRAHVSWLTERLKAVDATARQELERPARLMGWWLSRDVEEQERLARWWQDLPQETRVRRIAAWFDALPRVAQAAVGWPDWEQLTAAEREHWLRDGHKQLPAGLWPKALAWLEWQELDTGAKRESITQEVGPWHQVLSAARFALRPMDLWLDFKLVMAAVVVILGALSGFLLQYASRQQLSQPPDL
jgi:hypothetical protein